MSTLDRNYEISISLKDGRLSKTQNNFEIFTTDSNIFNIYITLKDADRRVVQRADLGDYTLKMHVVRPDLAYKEIECTLNADGTSDNFTVDLGADVYNAPGKYSFEFVVTKDTEKLTTSSDNFKVKSSIIDGLTQTYSLDFVTLSNMVQENTAIDDVKFDGKTMYFYSSGECVRRLYLDKAQISMEELVANEPYTAGKGIKISKNGVISMDTNVIRALIKETVKEGE